MYNLTGDMRVCRSGIGVGEESAINLIDCCEVECREQSIDDDDDDNAGMGWGSGAAREVHSSLLPTLIPAGVDSSRY